MEQIKTEMKVAASMLWLRGRDVHFRGREMGWLATSLTKLETEIRKKGTAFALAAKPVALTKKEVCRIVKNLLAPERVWGRLTREVWHKKREVEHPQRDRL